MAELRFEFVELQFNVTSYPSGLMVPVAVETVTGMLLEMTLDVTIDTIIELTELTVLVQLQIVVCS